MRDATFSTGGPLFVTRVKSVRSAARANRWSGVWRVLLAGLCASAMASEPLPADTRIKSGTLENGVTWLWRQHGTPAGKLALVMHVRTGSLNETDPQRGLAHFLEHMAFNGSENMPPGTLVPYFESIGMEFGSDLNAFTSFDQTVYMLYLPDTSVDQMDKALMVLSDYAFRMLLLPEEVDKERGVVLSERRDRMGPDQRLRDTLFEKIFAGTRLAERMPIGLEKVIAEAPRATVEDYYRTWYRPENITVLIVGDEAPDDYLPSVVKWFGSYRPAKSAPTPPGAGLKPFTTQRVCVLTDPEYARGDVDLYNLLPARPPVTTVEQARVELVDRVGAWILERRFSEKIKSGTAHYRTANASVMNWLREGTLVNASVTGEPKDWEQMLDALLMELNRVREFGFLAGEFGLCKKELLSRAEDAVRKESTRNARGLLMRMMSKVNQREPIMSAQQDLDLLQRLLPGITLDEVNAAYKSYFQADAAAFVVTLPQKPEVTPPAEEHVLAAVKAGLARRPEAPEDVKVAGDLLPTLPQPGKLAESTKEDDLGITSGWLSNGVRFHHKYMTDKQDTVLVTITLAGGEIEETPDNVGVTALTGMLLAQPATSRLTSTDIEDIMTGRNIRVGGSGEGDACTVTVSGSPRDLEIGLQLAYALLTDGKLEASAYANWKQAVQQEYDMQSRMPHLVGLDAWAKLVGGDDPRLGVLYPPERAAKQSREQSQVWFERLAREAPIEVAAVGDMPLDAVLPLVERYVGSLPARPRQAAGLDKLRKLTRKPGPYERRMELETQAPQAIGLYGFVGCDALAVPEVRALNLAANILDSRLVKRIREELGIVYATSVSNRPEAVYQDGGSFTCGAPCAPDQVDMVLKEIDLAFNAFADAGPTEAELDAAKNQLCNHLDTQLKEPSFWSRHLSVLDLHKARLEDLKNIPAAYKAISAERVREIFRKYYTPERTISVGVITKRPPDKEAGAAAPPVATPVGK